MKQYFRIIYVLISLIIMVNPNNLFAASVAKVTVEIVDENGHPVDNAQIVMCFFSGCRGNDIFRERTDDKGIFSKSSSSSDGRVGGSIDKKGYYSSSFHYAFPPFGKKFGRWQPWGKQMTVVLRSIVNPVPMYVRNRWFSVPEPNMEIGFDLMKADWVVPYGQGMTSDFIVRTKRKVFNDEIDSTLTITFSNTNDGIYQIKEKLNFFGTGSIYQLPRIAPVDGYQHEFVVRRYRGAKGNIRGDKDNNFIFRVRTEVDDDGRIINALYGKIRGDINFAPLEGDAGDFKMHYYLNPDGTRNLEFDVKRNLFQNLPYMEKVTRP